MADLNSRATKLYEDAKNDYAVSGKIVVGAASRLDPDIFPGLLAFVARDEFGGRFFLGKACRYSQPVYDGGDGSAVFLGQPSDADRLWSAFMAVRDYGLLERKFQLPDADWESIAGLPGYPEFRRRMHGHEPASGLPEPAPSRSRLIPA